MKKFYLFALYMAVSAYIGVIAQNVNNPGFESWENIGTDFEEPYDWNSFKTASGSLSGFGAKQIVRSGQTRPGTSGSYSAKIWSRSTLGIVANGNVTTGCINMGNISPSHQDNYNYTITADTLFSEAFTTHPDSMVFWAKFDPASGNTTDSARMHAIIHDSYDYRDPYGSDPNSANHIVAEATAHFSKTNGQWERKAVVFNYCGPASIPTFILITFTTNKSAGGGSGGDSLFIDDIEMIYSGVHVQETTSHPHYSAYVNPINNQLIVNMNFTYSAKSIVSVYSLLGQQMLRKEIEMATGGEVFDVSSWAKGIYVVEIQRTDGNNFVKKIALW